ncbi:Syntaxin-51 [Hibiscus syriacus]|uniref:Syntaxin-51 n=1 Tax=Hibiscus syriacus TaxID=106335 RepID=A0A6A2Y0M7_HIBSY|nr:Syntaxin-51 [Hibiscus syriacus]
MVNSRRPRVPQPNPSVNNPHPCPSFTATRLLSSPHLLAQGSRSAPTHQRRKHQCFIRNEIPRIVPKGQFKGANPSLTVTESLIRNITGKTQIRTEKEMNRHKNMGANLRSKANQASAFNMSNFANRDSLLGPEIKPDAMSRTVGLDNSGPVEQDEDLEKLEETVLSTKHIALAVNELVCKPDSLFDSSSINYSLTRASSVQDDLDHHVDDTYSRLRLDDDDDVAVMVGLHQSSDNNMVEMCVETTNATDIPTSSVAARRTEEAQLSQPHGSYGDENLVGRFGESLVEFSEDDEDIVPLVDDDDTTLVDESDIVEAVSEGQGLDVEADVWEATVSRCKGLQTAPNSYVLLTRVLQTSGHLSWLLEGVYMILDQSSGLLSTITRPENRRTPPNAYPTYCIHHIASNAITKFKQKKIKKEIINMGYALLQPNFCARLENLIRYGDDVYEFAVEIPRERWSQAYDVDGRRYGHMTTNLAECINSVLKGTQHLLIESIVRETYFRLGKVWADKSAQIDGMISDGRNRTPNLEKAMQKNQTHATSMFVHNFARLDYDFVVQALVRPHEGDNSTTYTGNLNRRWCDYG